jgi:hypothetical protein
MAAGVPARLTARQSRGREWLLRLILLSGSLLFSLMLAEVAVRAFFPINDGRSNVTLDGRPIKDWFEPGSVYRQISNEYDALTTITDKGHRVPGTDGNPDVIFLGDSFTYGYGLKDDETIAGVYCQRTGIACANLGIPGSGTARQVARLRQFIDKYQWKPKEVKLFFFGMSGSFSAGNDFADNYDYGRRAAAIAQGVTPRRETATPSLAGRVISWQASLMEYSYLVRRAKYHWGPLLKSAIVNDPGEQRMAQALAFTKQALDELDQYSREAGFTYKVYLLVPVQDLIRKTDEQTLAVLNSVSPQPAIHVAPALADSPASYYYAFDGHLNPTGSRRVAEFVMAGDAK